MAEPIQSHAEFVDNVRKLVERHGHMVVAIDAYLTTGEPEYAYTVGLAAKYGHEVIVFGCHRDVAQLVLNAVATSAAAGALEPYVRDGRYFNMPVKFMPCNDSVQKYVHVAAAVAGSEVRVLQLVVPDRNGKYPEDVGYDAAFMDHLQLVTYDLPN
jgi:hypothetical protein